MSFKDIKIVVVEFESTPERYFVASIEVCIPTVQESFGHAFGVHTRGILDYSRAVSTILDSNLEPTKEEASQLHHLAVELAAERIFS